MVLFFNVISSIGLYKVFMAKYEQIRNIMSHGIMAINQLTKVIFELTSLGSAPNKVYP
jgi:hypothetical protein